MQKQIYKPNLLKTNIKSCFQTFHKNYNDINNNNTLKSGLYNLLVLSLCASSNSHFPILNISSLLDTLSNVTRDPVLKAKIKK